MRRALILLSAAALVFAIALPAAAATIITTANGTWTAYPGQSTTYGAAVQQPINVDDSSNFKANGKAVIPVKFALSQGQGAFVFESVPGVAGRSAYSFLQFEPDTMPTLAQVTQLIAVYDFTEGDCQAGSLRWTLYLNDSGTYRNLDVHYQPGANGVGGQFCQPGTSGADMADLSSTDPYVVIQEFNHAPYSFSSSYNVTWSEAVDQLGGLSVAGMNLIVDSGTLAKPEVVDLSSATVQVGNGASPSYTETFTPLSGSATTPVCPTEEATISMTKFDGTATGPVNEPVTVQPKDNDGIFRIVDCKYMYNLATSSLSGVGTYTVYATIGSTTFRVGAFDLK